MAIAQNEFQGQTFSCEGVQQSQQCYTNGQQVLDQYNLHTFTVGETAGFLVALAAAFCVLGYIGLRFTAKPRFRFSSSSTGSYDIRFDAMTMPCFPAFMTRDPVWDGARGCDDVTKQSYTSSLSVTALTWAVLIPQRLSDIQATSS
ncbi:unnamed protein product [Jaminaea pallidilutea]